MYLSGFYFASTFIVIGVLGVVWEYGRKRIYQTPIDHIDMLLNMIGAVTVTIYHILKTIL